MDLPADRLSRDTAAPWRTTADATARDLYPILTRLASLPARRPRSAPGTAARDPSDITTTVAIVLDCNDATRPMWTEARLIEVLRITTWRPSDLEEKPTTRRSSGEGN